MNQLKKFKIKNTDISEKCSNKITNFKKTENLFTQILLAKSFHTNSISKIIQTKKLITNTKRKSKINIPLIIEVTPK